MDGIVGKSKLSSKKQVVVPKAVRLFLKMEPTEFLVWKIQDGRVYVERKVGAEE